MNRDGNWDRFRVEVRGSNNETSCFHGTGLAYAHDTAEGRGRCAAGLSTPDEKPGKRLTKTSCPPKNTPCRIPVFRYTLLLLRCRWT